MSNLISASKARLAELFKLQATIFRQTYNPEGIRNGSKVLRRKLRGDLIKEYYYPSKALPNASALNRIFPDLHCVDPKEHQRLQKNANQRRKGKGPPKKLKEKREVKGGKKK